MNLGNFHVHAIQVPAASTNLYGLEMPSLLQQAQYGFRVLAFRV